MSRISVDIEKIKREAREDAIKKYNKEMELKAEKRRNEIKLRDEERKLKLKKIEDNMIVHPW